MKPPRLGVVVIEIKQSFKLQTNSHNNRTYLTGYLRSREGLISGQVTQRHWTLVSRTHYCYNLRIWNRENSHPKNQADQARKLVTTEIVSINPSRENRGKVLSET